MIVGSGTLSILAAWMAEEGIADFLVDGRLPRTAGGVAANGRAEKRRGRLPRSPAAGRSRAVPSTPSGSAALALRGGERSAPSRSSFTFPKEQATLHGNWDVNALKGTGSQDMSVTDLFVPERHAYDNMATVRRAAARSTRSACPAS